MSDSNSKSPAPNISQVPVDHLNDANIDPFDALYADFVRDNPDLDVDSLFNFDNLNPVPLNESAPSHERNEPVHEEPVRIQEEVHREYNQHQEDRTQLQHQVDAQIREESVSIQDEVSHEHAQHQQEYNQLRETYIQLQHDNTQLQLQNVKLRNDYLQYQQNHESQNSHTLLQLAAQVQKNGHTLQQYEHLRILHQNLQQQNAALRLQHQNLQQQNAALRHQHGILKTQYEELRLQQEKYRQALIGISRTKPPNAPLDILDKFFISGISFGVFTLLVIVIFAAYKT